MIQVPDLTNGLFEFLGGALNWVNVRQLWRDKQLRGVHYFPSIFFTAWGYWNCFYYPHLHQWFSFVGGLVIVLANTAWVYLALKYRKN